LLHAGGPDVAGTRNNYNVGVEEVVEAWQTSATAEEAAKKLGMPKAILIARVSQYRSRKIKLKVMKRGRPGINAIDVERMNELAAKLGPVVEPDERVLPHNTEEEAAEIVRNLLRTMGR